jgi:CRP-like cAMP-binding protein
MDGAMSQVGQSTLRNRLLRALSPQDFALLQPHLEPVSVSRGDVIAEANRPIERIHFPEHGIASIVADTSDSRRLEVGIYGREGMSGTAVLLGSDRTPHENFYQVAGSAMVLPTDDLRRALGQSQSLQALLLRYVEALQIQTAYTALSNGSSTIEERLARWLLMCRDRTDDDELPLTHEFLGIMLGVRRSSVTLAIQVLEGAKVIQARRGHLKLLDRAKLREIAGDSYGRPEAEYERLIARRGDGSGAGVDAQPGSSEEF